MAGHRRCLAERRSRAHHLPRRRGARGRRHSQRRSGARASRGPGRRHHGAAGELNASQEASEGSEEATEASAKAAAASQERRDRKSTRLNSSHVAISYAVFCLKKKKLIITTR